jgi:hypothetical protein
MELEKIPSLIGVATFAALSAVVAHEWGYFGVIGSDFQALFTTYDYVSELLILIGPVFVSLVLWFGLQLAITYRRSLKSGNDVPKSKWGKWWEWFSSLLFGVLVILALLLSDDPSQSILYDLLALLWLFVVLYVLEQLVASTLAKSPVVMLVVLLIGLMIFMYGYGRDGAYTDLKDTTNQYRLILGKDKESGRSVKILRLLDRGAIVFDPATKAVEFHPREDIVLLQHDAPKWEAGSFACRHWGWNCIPVSGSSK